MYRDGESSTSTVTDSGLAYKLQSNDLVNIDITSTVDGNKELLNRTFNENNVAGASEASIFMRGYMIDSEGNIELPFVKKVKIGGLTAEEAERLVDSKLSEYLNHINIKLRLMSYRISYLGEFNRVGTSVIYSPKVTLLQAIANGGELTDFANRKKIVLYRTDEKGKVNTIVFDLTRKDIFNEAYFVLKPNDIIYAPPVRAKLLKSNSTNIALSMSVITFVLLMATYIKK
jgi:polysaccharide export outer membrane protein